MPPLLHALSNLQPTRLRLLRRLQAKASRTDHGPRFSHWHLPRLWNPFTLKRIIGRTCSASLTSLLNSWCPWKFPPTCNLQVASIGGERTDKQQDLLIQCEDYLDKSDQPSTINVDASTSMPSLTTHLRWVEGTEGFNGAWTCLAEDTAAMVGNDLLSPCSRPSATGVNAVGETSPTTRQKHPGGSRAP